MLGLGPVRSVKLMNSVPCGWLVSAVIRLQAVIVLCGTCWMTLHIVSPNDAVSPNDVASLDDVALPDAVVPMGAAAPLGAAASLDTLLTNGTTCCVFAMRVVNASFRVITPDTSLKYAEETHDVATAGVGVVGSLVVSGSTYLFDTE